MIGSKHNFNSMLSLFMDWSINFYHISLDVMKYPSINGFIDSALY